MDLNDAIRACRAGAFIRDESGTMKPGWKVKFVPSALGLEGTFGYVNPKGEDAHRMVFRDEHRASWQWRTVPSEYPNE